MLLFGDFVKTKRFYGDLQALCYDLIAVSCMPCYSTVLARRTVTMRYFMSFYDGQICIILAYADASDK